MKTIIRYSACILVTGIVFASGYMLGQQHGIEQISNRHLTDMSNLISDSEPAEKDLITQVPRRKPAMLM
ncbi:hypothetical protein ACO0K0_10065 [Undibacterium sp. SXout11W]|uniref:hypothetical protein n=1 Tax=Undibacterium sp. SXout11W TaxID=3413050 RepID=UPI003BF1ED66